MTKPVKDAAEKQLDRLLGFFSRADAKGSFLFAVNTGLLALLVLNLRLEDFWHWFLILPALLAVLLIAAGIYFLYRASFPSLKGGADSLIYFREIAKRAEPKFIDEFVAQSDEALTRDVLGQVWRNAEILKMKYDATKIAYILAALALIPWTAFLALAAMAHSGGLILK
jgi:hypothetical protein